MMTRTDKEDAKTLQMEYLQMLRGQFYGDNQKAYFQQRTFLIQGIGQIALYLRKRGVWLPLERQREILNLVIKEIKHHAGGEIRFFGGYFLDCMQKHMRFHGEAYYDEGKTAVAKAVNSMPFADILKGVQISEDPAQESDKLADFAQLARSGPRRGKKAKNNDAQQRMLL